MAATNDPLVVAALSKRLPQSMLRLPLTTLEGVKNRPETALELGARLPVHRLRLDNGESAIPLFTNRALCRACADRLSWDTDGKSIKTLKLPGRVALAYLEELLVIPGIDRALLNPPSDGALHLSRTDVEAMSSGRPLRSLWFYARNGWLKFPVEIQGSSLLSSFLTLADRALPGREASVSTTVEVIEPAPILDNLPGGGASSEFAAELYRLVSRERVDDVEITVAKSGEKIEVTARPEMPETKSAFLHRLRAVAEEHLAHGQAETSVSIQIRGGSIVLSSSSSSSMRSNASEESKGSSFPYIPLEPEEESRE